MAEEKVEIINDSGGPVNAQDPVFISASRSTDIPAFYSDWFFDRLKNNTCPHLCECCYANSSKENYHRHKSNLTSETIAGI
jgi:DNA repair photolyase